MNIRTSVLAGMFFLSSLGAVNSAMAEDGILYKQEVTPGSYCHEKFPAIWPSTLDTEHPTLKSQPSNSGRDGSGDVIDYYGSCDESPLGKDQIHEQKLEAQHRWQSDYND